MRRVEVQTQRIRLELSSSRMIQFFLLRKNEKKGREDNEEGNEGRLKRSQVGAVWAETGHEKSPTVDDWYVGAKYKCIAHADQRQVDTE